MEFIELIVFEAMRQLNTLIDLSEKKLKSKRVRVMYGEVT
jgi:hypothetical protein